MRLTADDFRRSTKVAVTVSLEILHGNNLTISNHRQALQRDFVDRLIFLFGSNDIDDRCGAA